MAVCDGYGGIEPNDVRHLFFRRMHVALRQTEKAGSSRKTTTKRTLSFLLHEFLPLRQEIDQHHNQTKNTTFTQTPPTNNAGIALEKPR